TDVTALERERELYTRLEERARRRSSAERDDLVTIVEREVELAERREPDQANPATGPSDGGDVQQRDVADRQTIHFTDVERHFAPERTTVQKRKWSARIQHDFGCRAPIHCCVDYEHAREKRGGRVHAALGDPEQRYGLFAAAARSDEQREHAGRR